MQAIMAPAHQRQAMCTAHMSWNPRRYRSPNRLALFKAVGCRAKVTLYELLDLVLPDQYGNYTARHCAMASL